ncbi:hypothetical protein Q8F55_001368 [Vanrija albida]|uniref:Enoyl reductase (ER) domain-containing protein n=1 Tax=Vanrija albida TaxID=181172 RepID=A0ABR3QFS8_9TREE
MKAIQITKYQHPSQLEISNIPAPEPKKGQVLVDIYAAGLNFFDILQAQGKYQSQPPFPFVLGAEIAGRISANSPIPETSPFKPGDRVLGYTQGAYAEQVAVDPIQLLPVPENISLEQATGVYLTYPTSYEGLVGRANAQPGEWVLVLAAAGGVGLAAVQIAKMLGCKVIAAAGSAEKLKIAVERGGADATVDYGKEGWQKEVLKITGGAGVDVVYDPVGMLVPSLKCVNWNARLVVVGFAAGAIEKVPANLLLLKNVAVVGLHWGATAKKDPGRYVEVIQLVLEHIRNGDLVPQVFDPLYEGLQSVPRGLVDIEKRKTWGKAVVRIRKDATDAKL